MFNSPILDLAIALSFTYFILGLLVSIIHEFIFSVLMAKQPKRAKYLKNSIENLFFDLDWKKFVQNKLFKNVHFEVLKKDKSPDSFPSYIPNSNFALAVIDQFREGNNLIDIAQIKKVLTDDDLANKYQITGDLRKTLLSFLERSDDQLEVFQKNLENYFDTAMDRLSGDYVRSTKRYIFLIAAILACSLNVDTIHIAKTLWESPDALKQTTDNIQATVKEVEKTGSYSIKSPDDKTVVMYSRIKEGDSIIKNPLDSTKIVPLKREAIKQTVLTLKNTGIPIGWNESNCPKNENDKKSYSFPLLGWIIKAIGLLLTTFALLLGAPFWFDLLNQIVNIRATGKKDSVLDKPNDKPVQPVTLTINKT